jgi:N-acetylmuramoyl-L-alanine amidase
VRGAVCVVTGVSGQYYRLADGSYIYKSATTYYPQTLGRNSVWAFKTTPETADRSTEIRLQMPIRAYYKVDLQEGQAVLTLYNTQFAWPVELKENPIVRDFVLVSEPNATHTVYAFRFHEGVQATGYYIEYKDEGLVIGFKQPPVKAADGTLKGVKILLDAGHGGSETGAVGAARTQGPMEKHLNLAITLYAEEYLKNLGATVVMTRADDTYISLDDRVQKIKEVKPDIAVSIHNNAVANTANQSIVRGYLSCYSLPAQEKLARYFTDAVSLAVGRPQNNSGIYSSNLALTRLTTCPAVLLENAFLSNPMEYEWLLKEDSQRKLGQEIGRAIEQYLKGEV